MATKPRSRKTETQLWVYDNAKRLGLSDADLGRATGVEPGTARAWFSRGKPNADAIAALERLFGRPAPIEDEPAGIGGDVAAAIRDQTAALTSAIQVLQQALHRRDGQIEALIRELATQRAERAAFEEGLSSGLRDLLGQGPQADPAPEPLESGAR